jgi:FMN phosphatase YigB (HAD superfamily)
MINLNKIVENKKLLFIDIDDTILDYTNTHKNVLNKILYKYNFNIDEYNIARSIVKDRIKGVNKHKKELYFKVMLENKKNKYSVLLDMINDYRNLFINNIKIDFSISQLIDYCKTNNIKVCAVSNFYVVDQFKKLIKFNILDKFDLIITSEDFDIEKPNINLFNYALNKFNIKSSESIMIGDSDKHDNVEGIDFFHYNTNNIFFGICGKSGSGKSTISNIIKDIFDCKILHGDNYHKYERDNKI